MIKKVAMRAAFFIVIFLGQIALAMPPSSYLSDVSQHSELLKQAVELRKKAKADLAISDALWATSLSAEVGYLDYETQTTGSSAVLQSGIQSQATVSQSTAYGLTAAFTATFLEDDDRDATESFSVSLEQELWNNAFGGADRAGLKAAEKTYEADLLEADLKAFEACDQAYDVYFTTWRAQEKLRILKDVLKLADQSFKITRRNFRRKLIRRIDFESANVDYLGVQDRVLDAENEFNRESENFKRYSKLGEKLSYSFQPANSRNSKKLLVADVSRLQYEALELLKNKEKSENRSEVNLFADADFTESPSSLSSTNTTETETYLIGLRFDFPWLDPVPSSTYKSAAADAMRAEQVWRKLQQDQKVEVDYLNKLLVETQKNLERQQERLKLRVSQVKQANKLLGSGKLEFDDYLRYRNGELEERLRGLDLVKRYWDTRLDILQATGDGAEKLCSNFIGTGKS